MIGMTLSLLATNRGVFTFLTIPGRELRLQGLERGAFCGVTLSPNHHKDVSAVVHRVAHF